MGWGDVAGDWGLWALENLRDMKEARREVSLWGMKLRRPYCKSICHPTLDQTGPKNIMKSSLLNAWLYSVSPY